MSRTGAPPVPKTGLVLRRDGSFWHEGVRVTHPKLHAAFLRGVRFLDDEGVFVTTLGHFRGEIEVEDTAFWVRSYEARTGIVGLSDGTCEPLEPRSLCVDPDGALRCTVKGRFPARFTRAGQAHLLESVDGSESAPTLRLGDRRVRLAGLA